MRAKESGKLNRKDAFRVESELIEELDVYSLRFGGIGFRCRMWKWFSHVRAYNSLKKLMAKVEFEKIKAFSSLPVPRIPNSCIRRIFQKKTITKIVNLL